MNGIFGRLDMWSLISGGSIEHQWRRLNLNDPDAGQMWVFIWKIIKYLDLMI